MTDKRSGGTSQVWLFLGPEIGEKEEAIDELRKKLSNRELEETVYYAGEMPVSAMVCAMLNGSLFADARLFFIKSAEGIREKNGIDLLSSYIDSPADNTFLVLISDETGIAKGLEKAVPAANKRIFWELADSRKTEWVQNFFKREGFRISADGIESILELVENNTSALRQECSRLALFLGSPTGRNGVKEGSLPGKAREVTAQDVEKWLSHTRQESAFTLFSRIAAGDFSRSLESMRMLLAAKEAPVAIFAGLAFCFRKLISYLALKDAGINDDGEYRRIGVSAPGARRDYAAAAARYNCAGAESCLALTAEYDFLFRSSSFYPQQILMDQYLYKIHSLAVR